nr:sulfatase [Cohnella zeiphila]
MFDSLNRHLLPNYGCDWIRAPHFARLSEQAVTFDNCYAGSLPCMPARRELHTGRYHFLHRSWGPLEPFDDSVVGLLRKRGVYTHLCTDHGHYFEAGGATYHTQYNSWEFARGQEGDPWKGRVEDPDVPESLSGPKIGDLWRQDWVNRPYLDSEEKQPLAVTVANGLSFIETNREQDNWFLQIEAFDPHEPFFTQQKYKDLYPHSYTGKHFDWPDYGKVKETPEEVRHAVYEYAALLSMCDAYLGQVLDAFDRLDLWKDTMLIVNTDHGFLLGEHRWWGKNIQPLYNEISHIPLFIWDPRYGRAGERRDSLVQTIDLAPTLLHYFGIKAPKDMQGRSLHPVIEEGQPVREAALFGIHGGHVNVTDGRYVYMRGPGDPANGPLHEYTLMPTHMHQPFDVGELADLELQEPFEFTKGCRTMKIGARPFLNPYLYGNLLFDLEKDSAQNSTVDDPEAEMRMIRLLARLMRENDAPPEQFERLGIPRDGVVGEESLLAEKRKREDLFFVDLGIGERWTPDGRNRYFLLKCLAPANLRESADAKLAEYLKAREVPDVGADAVASFAVELFGGDAGAAALLRRF